MYSRSKFSEEPYHIPENYRGNAFHGSSVTPEIPIAPPRDPDPPVQEPSPEPPPPIEEPTPVSAPPKKEPPSLLASLLPPKPKGITGGILGDIGAEELLIIGVILLLSQNDSDDDILLLLLLLLFYK